MPYRIRTYQLAPNTATTPASIIGRVDGLLRLELPTLALARYGNGPEVFEPTAYVLTVIQAFYGPGTDHTDPARAAALRN